MKFISALTLLLILFVSACQDDDNGTFAELQYDGNNNTAPFFEAGIHEAAARFSSNITQQFVGSKITDVEFYLVNLPVECAVKIYSGGLPSRPERVLYYADVTNQIASNSWNAHAVEADIEITGEPIWISIEVVHDFRTNSIGCDRGPSASDGDWFLEDGYIDWGTYRSITNGAVDINWNIHAFIQ